MSINLEIDTQQKLLRIGGMINQSVAALTNLILARSVKRFEASGILDIIDESVDDVSKDIITQVQSKKPQKKNGTKSNLR